MPALPAICNHLDSIAKIKESGGVLKSTRSFNTLESVGSRTQLEEFALDRRGPYPGEHEDTGRVDKAPLFI